MGQSTSLWARLKSRFSSSSNLSKHQASELIRENTTLQKRYYESQGSPVTPAPSTDVFSRNTAEYPEVRMPRIPYNLLLMYEMRYASVVLRTVCMKVKWEIFRATAKDGYVYIPRFEVKCSSCQKEFKEQVDYCDNCYSLELEKPDYAQQLFWENWSKEVNKAEQSLLKVLEQDEDDLNTADDAYLILQKKYLQSPEGKLHGKVVGVMRGDPVMFRIISDSAGIRGGKYFLCVFHRDYVTTAPGLCPTCNAELQDVHYTETESGGTNPYKYYVAGEVIHFSKYDPSATYGVSPIYTLWTLTRTLMLMDSYTQKLYEKGRMKGILGINTDDSAGVKEWLADNEKKLRNDPHHLPIIAYSSGENQKGKIEFVKLLDSLKDMEYGPAKELMRQQISALYGVSPIYQADFSSGSGLNNEGLQITVTDRAVNFGQSVYHNEVFPKLAAALGITDWDIQLQSSEENDEMAELQRFDQSVTSAQKMLQMGFDVEYINDEFVYSGQAEQQPSFSDQSFLPGSSQRPLLPSGPPGPRPANTQGAKVCPPGMQATPENPRCHPVEWDVKQKSLDGIKIFKMIRNNDESGISGTGWVATGIIYPDKQTVLRWNSATPSISVFNSFAKFKEVHITPHPTNETHLEFFEMNIDQKQELVKSFQLVNGYNKLIQISKLKKKDFDSEESYLMVNCKETTFQQELKEATMPNYKLFWTLDKVKLIGNPNNATRLFFKTTNGVRGFFKIKGYGQETYKGKSQPVVYFNREFYPSASITKQRIKEPGRKIRQERNQIENLFLQSLIETTTNELFHPLELLSQVQDKSEFNTSVDQLVQTFRREVETKAFAELVRAYLEGKKINVNKAVRLPTHLNFESLPIAVSDLAVIRAIYSTNPFWQSFRDLSQNISNRLKAIIADSYVAPSEQVFQDEFTRVQNQHPTRSRDAQLNITYGRIGKLDLRKIIQKMQQEVQHDFYKLERIVRTETTAVTNKGREIVFEELEAKREVTYLYDWHGPNDQRTSDICKTIKGLVATAGQGAGVPLNILKEIHIEVVNRLQPGWDNGTVQNIRWVPHANCRHVLRRTGEV